jgi:predicted dehydrogenase
MKQYNIGVIGIGDISDVYFNNLKKYDIVNLVSCASRGLDKARRKAEQHGLPEYYASGHELIEKSDVDIILNLTTPAAHGEYNIAALEAGKHIYTEKPLAADFEEARRMTAIAAQKGLVIASAPDTFLGGRLQTCRSLMDEGKIGRPVAASAFVVSRGHEWHHPNPDFFYQEGGGPLLDIGPYYITALLALLGPVARVNGMSSRALDKRTIMYGPRIGEEITVDVDTHITANLEFVNGALGTVITSFDIWDSQLPRIEIYGTEGTICIPDLDPLSGPNLFGGPIWLKTEENCRWKGQPREDPLPEWTEIPVTRRFSETGHDVNSRGIGLVDMAYGIRDNREPRASGAMAFHSMETMQGVLDSASEHRFVEIKSRFDRPEPLPEDFPESEG